jgi:hypothetical protein
MPVAKEENGSQMKWKAHIKKAFKFRVPWNRADWANYQAEMDLLQHVPIESEMVLDHPEQRVDAILEGRHHCSVVQ